MCGCNDYSDVKSEIEKANALCPINSAGGSITSFSFDEQDKAAVVNCLLDEDLMSLSKLSAHKDLLKKLTVLNVVKNAGSFQPLADKGIGLKYVYAGNQSKEKITFSLTNDELKSICNGSMVIDGVKCFELNVNELILENILEVTNTQLPKSIATGIVWQNASKDVKYVNFNYICDEQYVSLERLNSAKEEAKQAMLGEMNVQDVSVKNLLECCKQCRKEISYNFIGKQSGQTLNIIVTHKDIQSLLKSISGQESL